MPVAFPEPSEDA